MVCVLYVANRKGRKSCLLKHKHSGFSVLN